MSPEQAEIAEMRRAAWALFAAVAERDADGVTAILGPGWADDRRAQVAIHLADVFGGVLRRIGPDDPAGLGRDAIAMLLDGEARGAGP